MPTSQAPTEVTEPKGSTEPNLETEGSAPEASVPGGFLGLPLNPKGPLETNGSGNHALRGSRWVDYDTHELLEMIGELEDERRWSRLREGFWIALLAHILFISAITWIPTYIFKVPKVVDPFDVIKERKDLAYLDLPPDALREKQPRVVPKPLPNQPLIDKKTLDELNREAPPTPPPPAPQQAPDEAKPQPSQPIPPSPQSQVEAPRPAAVPARPNFAMGSQNPADQLRQDMKNAMRGGQPSYDAPSGGLSMHPGAGTGGVQILSDTQGVDFNDWLQRWHYITQMTWDPLIPDEVNPPILKSGVVVIHFKVLPNGQVTDMQLDGRSGDTGLDRAAWGAITGSSYPALPRAFHGPYLELRAYFMYNMQPQ
ncbi:MAG TPA: TonB family protein [Candidatus Sulfotelmatobacter sp.]|nr:TonB family protein [Candidatus Sulfotelmatobacter sp.]